jgi:hypothetical protein
MWFFSPYYRLHLLSMGPPRPLPTTAAVPGGRLYRGRCYPWLTRRNRRTTRLVVTTRPNAGISIVISTTRISSCYGAPAGGTI